jgi:dTDP-glucose 4,6-dehydratase
LNGDGKNVRDWHYVGDHCAGIRAVLARGRVGETYNIGGNSERTNLQVVHALCTTLDQLRPAGAPHTKLIQFVADRPGHDRRYAIDASKIRRELGWQPTESFEAGLAKTIAWYLDHSEWVENVTSGAYRQWMTLNYGARI